MAEPIRKALVLPGAGARGAYQVGVLKAIASLLPRHAPNPFAIISGTSAGAINAAVLASRAAHFERAVSEMERVWANFRASQIFKTDSLSMLKSSLQWLVTLVTGGLGAPKPVSLLDNSPLRALIERDVRFPGIAKALRRGHLEALAVTASGYTSARSVTFYQSAREIPPWSRVRRDGRPALIGVNHLMASAAVPFFFPPVRIGDEYFGDGAMRHRAPLSSAIHLGGDRLLVIGVRDEHREPEPKPGAPAEPPSLAQLLGYVLDTLFLDGLQTDVERLVMINRLLEQTGTERLTGAVANLRPIHTLIVTPREDIRPIAERHLHELPRPVRLLLRGVGVSRRNGMQLVSYMLFESGYTRELIDMGYRDAMAMEEDIRAFIYDQPMDTFDAPAYLKADIEQR
ncbi:MAG TPA: patatin-like phospholipase family protein [Gammaproteobacteria bacterium]